jgi:hypothetical protein
LVAEKQTWITREPKTARERRDRFEALRALTHQMRPYLAERLRETRHQCTELDHQLQANAILRRRDYAFCLFPEESLRPFVTSFLSGIPSTSKGQGLRTLGAARE